MDTTGITFRWFDLVTVALIMVGIFHGRKNGMSQELFNTMKWLAILTLTPLLYHPVGRLILKFVPIKAIYGYVAGYVLVAAVLKGLLVTVRKKIKDKMSDSDVFGRAEYPLGMVAGAFQYGCMIVMVVACLNAKYINEEALLEQERIQREALGEKFFASAGNLHKDALMSITGRTLKKYMGGQLIKPVDSPDPNKW